MTATEAFTVFYAIFWGAIANVQPKWKAFHWPLCFKKTGVRKQVIWRVALSVLTLNVFPILYFWFAVRAQRAASNPSPVELILYGVIPSFAIFGFSRLWLGIVEMRPAMFYGAESIPEGDKGNKVEPGVKDLWAPDGDGLLTAPMANLCVAVAYIFLSALPLLSLCDSP